MFLAAFLTEAMDQNTLAVVFAYVADADPFGPVIDQVYVLRYSARLAVYEMPILYFDTCYSLYSIPMYSYSTSLLLGYTYSRPKSSFDFVRPADGVRIFT